MNKLKSRSSRVFLTLILSCSLYVLQAQLACDKACDCIDVPELASLMDWQGRVKSYPGGFWKISSCEYQYKFDILKISIKTLSKKSIEKGYLSTQYRTLLKNGDGGVHYTNEINTDSGQTIYGHGHDEQNRHTNILRRRFGEEKEVTIRFFTKEEDHKLIKRKLNDLMEVLVK